MKFKHTIQKSKWWTLTIITVTSILTSCQKELKNGNLSSVPINKTTATSARNVPYQEGSYVLGEPKQNPYIVSNMQSSYSTLAARGILPPGTINIRATHYYVKFKPQNFDQYETLCKDSILDLSDLPIEANVLQNGDSYHDPSLPDSIPTYQYTAVPANYSFDETIPYEIIDNLYIPESDSSSFNEGSGNNVYLDKLLDQAYIQTGNYEDTVKYDTQDPQRHYYPGGRIRVSDTRLNTLIGMEGVDVHARRWFIVQHAQPDYNGFYRMKRSLNRAANYSIWFHNILFTLRRHLIATTVWINGPKQTGDWNYDINDGYYRFAGHVFRGAYRYHWKDIGGLARPWLIPGYRRQAYIASNSYSSPGINWGIFPVIKIGRYLSGTDVEYRSDEIFSATCHETGHTSHMYRMNGGLIQFIQVEAELRESWAVAIEWYLTHIEYAERGINNYGEWDYHPANPPIYPNEYAYQFWFKDLNDISGEYTPIYIDLVDSHNENGVFYPGWGFGTVNDQVTGYTLPTIESDFLKHVYGLSSLSTQLKSHKPAGVTDAQIDLLIGFY